MFPVKVAAPPVLDTETEPDVVKCPMFCVAVPVMITGELPALKIPAEALIKSPYKVSPKLLPEVLKVAPSFISN